MKELIEVMQKMVNLATRLKAKGLFKEQEELDQLMFSLRSVCDEFNRSKQDYLTLKAIKYALELGYSDFDSDSDNNIFITTEDGTEKVVDWYENQLKDGEHEKIKK